ncbi:hypothetical protein [Leminorella grimontii]|uniref:hypothetical protein n=1 Tax=Leminorella grimontii TaxID=82981 RepID=UPI00208D6E93|nr:hypothetical protein [Leminorella grimontii]GKX59220.1 hypothetical protein SOASR031_15350 [Leminorella grimontii]
MKKKKATQPLTLRERCRQIFGNPPPPRYVWEKEFDYCDEQLQALAVKEWDQIQARELSGYYLLNLAYVEPLQPELFRYLFPICLAVWCESLTNGECFEDFLHVTRRGRILEKMVTAKERDGILNALGDSFIHRLEQERGFIYSGSFTPAYQWLYAFNDLGETLPVIEPVWQRWWNLDTPGKAVCAIMYASGLIYENGENPIFHRWNKTHGGGGPYLAELSGSFDSDGWLPENLSFFKRALTADWLLENLERAASVLQGEQEEAMANAIVSDARQRQEIITIQINDLIDGLAPSSGAN